VKNAQDAMSETIREGQKEWYRSTFYTREEPEGGAICVIQTRWNEDDLCGWLLSEEEQGDEPERWHIVNLPALAEDRPQRFPATCTVEPDWRLPGEPLCPERYSERQLHRIRERVGSYYWAALYQGHPQPREGNYFKRAWFEIVPGSPSEARRVRYWDKAATALGGDYTSGVRMACHQGVFYVEDVVRGQWAPAERDAIMRQTAQLDRTLARELSGGDVKIGIEREGGSAGKDSEATTTRMMAGFPVKHFPATGSKEVRADALASQAQAGNVKIVSGRWNGAFLDELCSFPAGAHDDQCDSSSGAFHMLALPAWWEDPELREWLKQRGQPAQADAKEPVEAPAAMNAFMQGVKRP